MFIESFANFLDLFIVACFFHQVHHFYCKHIATLIGLPAQIIENPLLDGACSLANHLFLANVESRNVSLSPPLSPSTVLC